MEIERGVRIARHSAFTLVELLAVIAIIGILAGLVLPATLGAGAAADRSRVRIRFQQWAAAIEDYRREYGVYPVFSPDWKLNGGATTDPAGPHPFHDVLVGRRRDGTPLPIPDPGADDHLPESQNRQRIRFLEGSAIQLVSPGDGNRENLLCDPVGGTDIAVIVDGNLDGVIDYRDCAEFPAVSPADDPGLLLAPEREDLPVGGIRAGVAFYAAPRGARFSGDLILSWK